MIFGGKGNVSTEGSVEAFEWEQATGLLRLGGLVLGRGYSGSPFGRNNPAFERVANVGPIPRGLWSLEKPRDTKEHGPFVIPLVPEEGTDTFGREGFLIHGDSIKAAGTASHGCIILSRALRERISKGPNKVKVI